MGLFDWLFRRKKKEVRKELEMPKPWSKVEKYKKVKKNNFIGS